MDRKADLKTAMAMVSVLVQGCISTESQTGSSVASTSQFAILYSSILEAGEEVLVQMLDWPEGAGQ